MTARRVVPEVAAVSEAPAGAVNGSNAAFALTSTPRAGSLALYLNGLLQRPGLSNDYVLSGGTVTFNAAPLAGDSVWADYLK